MYTRTHTLTNVISLLNDGGLLTFDHLKSEKAFQKNKDFVTVIHFIKREEIKVAKKMRVKKGQLR